MSILLIIYFSFMKNYFCPEVVLSVNLRCICVYFLYAPKFCLYIFVFYLIFTTLEMRRDWTE